MLYPKIGLTRMFEAAAKPVQVGVGVAHEVGTLKLLASENAVANPPLV